MRFCDGHGYKAAKFPTFRSTSWAVERTLSIIKPDAHPPQPYRRHRGPVREGGAARDCVSPHASFHRAGEAFYGVHSARPFFRSLVDFMTSGPVVVQVLEGENAIAKNREVMGATDPAKAAEGTIRKDFAESIEANSVHGSDAPDTAANEDQVLFQ